MRGTREGQNALMAVSVTCALLVTAMGNGQSRGAVTQIFVSANHRYLVDQNQDPYLLQGDAAWSLIVAADDAEVEQYLRNRRDKGFNTVMVNLIEHRYAKEPPLNEAGEAPFATPGDFPTAQ